MERKINVAMRPPNCGFMPANMKPQLAANSSPSKGACAKEENFTNFAFGSSLSKYMLGSDFSASSFICSSEGFIDEQKQLYLLSKLRGVVVSPNLSKEILPIAESKDFPQRYA